jgi:hypothetical protein
VTLQKINVYYMNELWSCLVVSKVNREIPLGTGAVHPHDGLHDYFCLCHPIPSYNQTADCSSLDLLLIVMNIPGWLKNSRKIGPAAGKGDLVRQLILSLK